MFSRKLGCATHMQSNLDIDNFIKGICAYSAGAGDPLRRSEWNGCLARNRVRNRAVVVAADPWCCDDAPRLLRLRVEEELPAPVCHPGTVRHGRHRPVSLEDPRSWKTLKA